MSTGALIGCLLSIESRVDRVVGRPQRLVPFLGKVGTVTGLCPPS